MIYLHYRELERICVLNGCCKGVPAYRRLTQLRALDSQLSFIKGAEQNVGIQDLYVLMSKVCGIHENGLSGCTRLHALDIAKSAVTENAAWAPDEMDEHKDSGLGCQYAILFVPATSSDFSQLTTLKIKNLVKGTTWIGCTVCKI